MKNWKRCVVYKSVNIQWGFVSTKKLTDHVTMTTVITFARPCAKGHEIIMIEIAQENKRKKTKYYNIDPWVQGLQLDRTTRCHFMSDTQLIRSDWFHPLIKSYRPNTPLTKQRNQKTTTYFTKESKQRIHLNDMTFPLTVSQ